MFLTTQLSVPADSSSRVPRLLIGRNAWLQMQAFVSISPAEINGFAYVSLLNGDFYVLPASDIFITKQTVTTGTAKVDGSIFAKALYRAGEDGRSEELRLQWHSHVNGDAYFSSTDMGTIENYGQAGMDWFISLVTNKRGQVVARVDRYQPFRTGCEIPVIIFDTTDPDFIDNAARSRFEELVTIEEPEKQTTTAQRLGRAASTSPS